MTSIHVAVGSTTKEVLNPHLRRESSALRRRETDDVRSNKSAATTQKANPNTPIVTVFKAKERRTSSVAGCPRDARRPRRVVLNQSGLGTRWAQSQIPLEDVPGPPSTPHAHDRLVLVTATTIGTAPPSGVPPRPSGRSPARPGDVEQGRPLRDDGGGGHPDAALGPTT